MSIKIRFMLSLWLLLCLCSCNLVKEMSEFQKSSLELKVYLKEKYDIDVGISFSVFNNKLEKLVISLDLESSSKLDLKTFNTEVRQKIKEIFRKDPQSIVYNIVYIPD